MINRIVRMSFDPDRVQPFLELFAQRRLDIAAFDGCVSLQLLQDAEEEHVFFTYSVWESPAHLLAYRKSETFKDIWSKTRIHFNSKPMAWSTRVIDSVK